MNRARFLKTLLMGAVAAPVAAAAVVRSPSGGFVRGRGHDTRAILNRDYCLPRRVVQYQGMTGAEFLRRLNNDRVGFKDLTGGGPV